MPLKDLYFSKEDAERLSKPGKFTHPTIVACDITSGEVHTATAIMPNGMLPSSPCLKPGDRIAIIEAQNLFYFEDRMGKVKDHLLAQHLSELDQSSAARVVAAYSKHYGKLFPRGAAAQDAATAVTEIIPQPA